MTSCYVIGNGFSRRDIDLTKLSGTTIGCNEIYKTFVPDYLVALDIEPQKAITESGVKGFIFIAQNQQRWLCRNGVPFVRMDDFLDGRNNNSGVVAAWFAAEILKCDKLFLIGFDFFRPVPRDDTRFHFNGKRSNDITNGNYWVGPAPFISSSMERIAKEHPGCEVIRVGEIMDWDRQFYEETFKLVKLIPRLP